MATPKQNRASTNGAVRSHGMPDNADEIEYQLAEVDRERGETTKRWDKKEKALRAALKRLHGSRYKRLALPLVSDAADSGLPILPITAKEASIPEDVAVLLERIPVTTPPYDKKFIEIAKRHIMQSGGAMPKFSVQFMRKLDGTGADRMITTWILEGAPSPEFIFTLQYLCEQAYGRKLWGYADEKWPVVQRETPFGKADAGWYGISMSPYSYNNLALGITVMRRYQHRRDVMALRDRNGRDWICLDDPSRKQQRTIIQARDGIYNRDDHGLFQDEWFALNVQIAYVIQHGILLPSRNLYFAGYRDFGRIGIERPQTGFSGMQKVVDAVKSTVFFPVSHPDIAQQYGVRPGSVLLAGPPGTGKTFLVHHLIWEDHPVVLARITGDKLRKDLQRDDRPSVILERIGKIRERTNLTVILLIDDIESLLQSPELVNRLLELMNGVSAGGFLVIGSTNKPEEIDDRLFQPGRFDFVLHVGLPDRRERVGALDVHLVGKPFRSDAEQMDIIARIAAETEGWSQRLLGMIANRAGLLAAQEMQNFGTKVMLEWRHFAEAINFVRNTNNLNALRNANVRIAQFVSYTRGKILSPSERIAATNGSS